VGPDPRTPEEGSFSEPTVHVELGPKREREFAAIVSLRGEHDLATAPEVSNAIGAIDGNVLVDLSQCTFIDSTVIAVLFARNQKLEGSGRYLEIVAPRENTRIARTLELVRMRDVIVVHEARPGLDLEDSAGA
jgi:anti-sigma B factor antagonist